MTVCIEGMKGGTFINQNEILEEKFSYEGLKISYFYEFIITY